MRIVLVEPEIPQNTGTIARLAAAVATPLDLVGQLGFSLEDRYLKRAGLDYWPLVDVSVHASWDEYLLAVPNGRLIAFSARAERSYTHCEFRQDDRLVFGKETAGLAPAILRPLAATTYTIPMEVDGVRSLNLANAVSIAVFEARRQLGLLD